MAQSGIACVGQRVFYSAWNDEAFVDVAAGMSHSLALRSNGTMVAFGDNGYGQCMVPVLPPGSTYVDVEAG
ncbi:MAG: RCC1 domain-containing protein, partial [Planctomycetota bacterium]